MSEKEFVNIASHLADMATRCASEAAVICPRKHGPDGQILAADSLTFEELDARCDRVARGLVEIGIDRGTRTVLMVSPSLDFFALTFALFKIGAVPVLVDPGMGIKNLGVCLAEAEPEAFVGIPKAHVARSILGWGKATLRTLVTVGPRLFWGGHSLRKLTRGASTEPFPCARTEAGETAAILFTSGSTGIPKGAVYSHANFAEQVRVLKEEYGIAPGETDLATFPLFALFGPALGMCVVVPDMDASRPGSADPKKIMGPMLEYGATNMFGSPALIDRVGKYGKENGIKLPTLKRVLSAGAPANNDALETFSAMLPLGVEIHTPYGATESLPVCSIGSNEIFSETAKKTLEGAGTCVGKPVGRTEVFIIEITDEPISDWSDDLVLPRGEIGEIAVTGPVVTREYFNRPENTALAKIADPEGDRFFHRMGDVGYFDEKGRLWFCGRKTHRVETANGTMFTIPYERVFNQHPDVRRTALVGVPDGAVQRPVLCVERLAESKGKPDQNLKEEILSLGAKLPFTKDIEAVLFHPSFPVDVRHNSKIFREKLALWAGEQPR